MQGYSGRSLSPWFATADTPVRASLPGNTHADVCVVRAGLAGLSTAYRLTREGVSVVVVDDGPIGVGQTGRTTAHLSNAIDDLYQTIEKIHGRDGARPAAESHTAAVDAIESIAAVEDIPVRLRTA